MFLLGEILRKRKYLDQTLYPSPKCYNGDDALFNNTTFSLARKNFQKMSY
jgi:hypothetical protein